MKDQSEGSRGHAGSQAAGGAWSQWGRHSSGQSSSSGIAQRGVAHVGADLNACVPLLQPQEEVESQSTAFSPLDNVL